MRLFTFLRLAVMMALQYAIWGAWRPVLAVYLQRELHFSGAQTGAVYSLMWLACIATPFLGGQIADRWVPTQFVMAAFHLTGGLAMWQAAHSHTFSALWPWMLLYALAFAPTLALTNSLTFKHLADISRQFGSIRVFGTLGWIAAGLILSAWRGGAAGLTPFGSQADCLLLAAVCSFAMAGWCLLLPHTPPSRKAETPWAFLRAVKMAYDSRFLVFLVLMFVVTTMLEFYYMLAGPFLNDLGVSVANVPRVMTLAQFAEIPIIFLALPFFLPRLGFRKTLGIGMVAWPIRYIIWTLVALAGGPLWVALCALGLHGFCSAFLMVASQLYVDRIAPGDVRHSAQAFLTFVTLGVGNYFGTLVAGFLQDRLSHVAGPLGAASMHTNWALFFMVPMTVTALAFLGFALFFREIKPGELHEPVATIRGA
jgi:nucleoside transporter